MRLTWVQDGTGRNVIHRAGCAHLRMDTECSTFDGTVEAAMILVAQDNADPDVTTADEASEWVSVAPCAR